MEIYNKLNELTRAIQQSDEFKKYEAAAKKIDENPEHSQMMSEFIKAQVQLSTLKMLGQNPDSEMIDNFNKMYTSLMGISGVSEFMQAQIYFSKVMEDVSKEIGNAVQVDANFLKGFTQE